MENARFVNSEKSWMKILNYAGNATVKMRKKQRRNHSKAAALLMIIIDVQSVGNCVSMQNQMIPTFCAIYASLQLSKTVPTISGKRGQD